MTNSKKIKRNIGASRRLAPFGHVRSITFTIMLLAVALIFGCRKSGGGGGITQTDPIRNLAGNLLIVSTNGKTNLNSLPLSFVGASDTVTEVTENPKKLNLDPTNFIIADGTLKLTNIDLSTADAAVSNKVTLTFDLSASSSSPITRYTDTADIFVGKMQTNISVETLKKLKFDVSDTVKGQESFDGDQLVQSTIHKSIFFKNANFKADASDNSKFILENENTGDDGN